MSSPPLIAAAVISLITLPTNTPHPHSSPHSPPREPQLPPPCEAQLSGPPEPGPPGLPSAFPRPSSVPSSRGRQRLPQGALTEPAPRSRRTERH